MTVREFQNCYPGNFEIVVADYIKGYCTRGKKKSAPLYDSYSFGIPFCLLGYKILRIEAQKKNKVILYINTTFVEDGDEQV